MDEPHKNNIDIHILSEQITILSDALTQVLDCCDGLMKRIDDNTNSIQQLAIQSTDFINTMIQCHGNFKYEFCDPRYPAEDYFFPHIMDTQNTIDEIVKNQKSLSRFGDGEFSIILNKNSQPFQALNPLLSRRLKEVIDSNIPNLMIAVADNYGSLEKYTDATAHGIRVYMTPEIRKAHEELLDKNRSYHNAYLTRPYIIYRDNMTDAPKKRFKELKQIWEKRDVIFVEGSLTRLGVGNDLFSNAHSIQRILAPSINAFDRYDDILSSCLKHGNPDSLFLVALGPTASILTHDLCLNYFQAVDIGHLDLEYEWFLQGKGIRCSVPTKFNNEFIGGNQVDPIEDPLYFSQIIDSII